MTVISSAPLLATNLVLVGFMGSGKSSVGRLLATRLGFRFVDTDALVTHSAGMPITDIFARRGEEAFREMETAALASLLGKKGLVVATGGGIVTREANLPMLHELGYTVGLLADEKTIFERVSRNNRRPLLQTADPRRTIAELLAARAPLYTAAAQQLVETSEKTHAEVAAEILEEALRRFPVTAEADRTGKTPRSGNS